MSVIGSLAVENSSGLTAACQCSDLESFRRIRAYDAVGYRASEIRVLSAEDRFAIEALHRAWLDAELRGDSPALLKLCTAAPVWLPPNEAPLCGKPAILSWLENQPHASIRRIEIEGLAISGIGSFAWKLATFRTTVEGPAGAGAEIVTGSHGWLLQRDDTGAWRISVVVWTIGGTPVA